ncbi:MAG: hypothetical protein HZB38_03230 [Planctomycetes bacterium]|nr:hypothetical protein [Planctomycetota bacterium]
MTWMSETAAETLIACFGGITAILVLSLLVFWIVEEWRGGRMQDASDLPASGDEPFRL